MSPTPDFDPAAAPPRAAPDDALDNALRRQWQADDEPADDGFSLRVMAALPAARPARHRAAAVLRLARWTALSLAACGAASLLTSATGPLDGPHALAAGCLLGLLIFWSVPARWNRS